MSGINHKCGKCDVTTGPMYLHSKCHPEMPTWAVLEGQILKISCAFCDKLIVKFRIEE